MPFPKQRALIFCERATNEYINKIIHTAKHLMLKTLLEMCKTVENPNFPYTVITQVIHKIVIIAAPRQSKPPTKNPPHCEEDGAVIFCFPSGRCPTVHPQKRRTAYTVR